MREKSLAIALLVLMLVVFPLAVVAQTDAPEGIQTGGYNIQQSVEFGYRFTDITTPRTAFSPGGDDPALFNTFVNLQEGPRLLEQTLSMRSLANTGVLFDNLYISSFGWGGDPNNVARVRVSKNKWYNFSGSFRRDQNYFDYDLLANPMNNPLTPNILALQVPFSPHSFAVTRRMADFNLTMLPQSKLTFRAGYSRNRANGPSITTNHEAGDTIMAQPWNTTYQTWNAGFDMKFIPKTNISFDQFLQYGKQDTNTLLDPTVGSNPFVTGSFGAYPIQNPTSVGGYTAVEEGLIPTINPGSKTSAPAICVQPSGYAGVTNCSGYFDYNRYQRLRTTTPTSQLSFQSHPHKNVELTGRFSYSWMDLKGGYDEVFNGLVTRTREKSWTITGPVRSQVITGSGDFGVTINLTEKLTLSNTFRFLNERAPSTWDYSENILSINCKYPLDAKGACPSSPPAGYTGPLQTYNFTDCVNPATGALVLGTGYAQCQWAAGGEEAFGWLNNNLKYDTTELTYQFNKVIGGRVGYRIGTKLISYQTERGLENWDITEHTGLFGLWLRPSSRLRANAELELMSNDGVDTRIAPRQQQHYRIRTSWSPSKELTLTGTGNFLESKNPAAEINYKGHNRNVGFTTTINASKRFGFDFSYNYSDYLQNAWMCFADTVVSPTQTSTGFVAPGTASACPTWAPSAAGGGYLYTSPDYTWSGANPADRYIYNTFQDKNHNGSFLVRFQPVKRVTANVGYSFTVVDGDTQVFNMAVPLGALKYTYSQPLASLSVDVAKNFTFNTYWNYDQYNEDSTAAYKGVSPWGPTQPRYFHDNRATLSVRYAF